MVLNGMAPQFVSDLIRKKSSCQSALRSNDLKMLHVVMHTAVERNVRHWVIRHLPKLGLQCGTSFQRPFIYSLKKTAKNTFVQRSLHG